MIRIKNTLSTVRLPSEYQEVEYLESTGTQYIDTGLVMASGYSVEAEIGINDTKIAFGASSTYSSSNNLGIEINSSHLWTRGRKYTFTALTTRGKYKLNITFGSNVRYLISTADVSLTASYYNLNYFLFACNEKNVASWNGGGIIWAYKIKNGSELIRDYVPCYRKSDNVAGLYDLANSTFYANAGTGTFLIGNEVGKRDLNINPAIEDSPLTRAYAGDKLIYGEAPASDEQLVNYTMLYDRGDECTDVTGGWGYYLNTGVDSYYSDVGSLTKNTDNIQFLDTTTTGSHTHDSLFTRSTIDISEYVGALVSSEVVSWTNSTTTYAYDLYFCLQTSPTNASSTYTKLKNMFLRNLAIGKYAHTIKFGEYTTTSLYVGIVGNTENCSFDGRIHEVVLTKQDNWQDLCTIAGINPSNYTDEETLCSDSTAIATILSNRNAVKFMIYQCTGSFMANAISSSTFLTALNNSSYNTTIQANEHWNKFLSMVV